VVRRFGMTGQS